MEYKFELNSIPLNAQIESRMPNVSSFLEENTILQSNTLHLKELNSNLDNFSISLT